MNFMLKLKNIKIKNNIAQADFSPENTNIWGHIEVNLQSREITSCNNVEGYGSSYRAHAKWKLVELAQTNEPPTECLVMWC